MDTANALDDTLEKTRNKVLYLVNLANFKYFLQFSEEKGLLDTVSKRPVLKESFKKRNSEGAILGQEKHGASEQLLVELGAGLHLVQWNDNIFEENDVFISEWDCETRNNRGEDI